MKKCIICKKSVDRYVGIEKEYLELPAKYGRKESPVSETLNAEEYSCPHCYALDRDRLCGLFLEELLQAAKDCMVNILDIAPSGAVKNYIYSHLGGGINYYTADLFMSDVDYKVDIQNMEEIKDGSFQLIICCHVLEHVKDDKLAMKELYRILDPNGLAIILVPLDLNQTVTDEEWGLSEEENWRRFGQGDHVRKYAKKDFISRLEDTGFTVYQLGKKEFGRDRFAENALTDTSILYVVGKSPVRMENKTQLIRFFGSQCKRKGENCCVSKAQVNYWIDCCKEENGMLVIWGWFYFMDTDSRRTKARAVFIDSLTGREKMIGTDLQKREDIVKTFGNNEKQDCLYSGIAINIPLASFEESNYGITLIMNNMDKTYCLEVTKDFAVHRKAVSV